jgi:hypothetical protein
MFRVDRAAGEIGRHIPVHEPEPTAPGGRSCFMRPSFASLAFVALIASLASCSVPGGEFAASITDAPIDTPMQPPDASVDGDPSTCTPDMPCCTPEGAFRGTDHACGTRTEYQCDGLCSGQPQQRTVEQFCSGTSGACNGAEVEGTFAAIPGTPACGAGQACGTDGTEAPTCTTCPGGCTGTTCAGVQCTEGVCCSEGRFEGTDSECASTVAYECGGDNNCGATPLQRTTRRFCNGASATCEGETRVGSPEPVPGRGACGATQLCQENGTSPPSCSNCQFGCSANSCTAAECESGPCCVGGRFASASVVCEEEDEYRCNGACGGQPQERAVRQFCSGSSNACSGRSEETAWTNSAPACNGLCSQSGDAEATCAACPFGCDSQSETCAAGSLWLFPTHNSTQPNFGGRTAADNLCRGTFDLGGLGVSSCTRSTVHAVLRVDADDTLEAMPSRFNMPAFRVKRASDGAEMAPSWSSLVFLDTQLTQSLTTGALQFWTGQKSRPEDASQAEATCDAWTTIDGTKRGNAGQTNVRNRWLINASKTCNSGPLSLVCVCWLVP